MNQTNQNPSFLNSLALKNLFFYIVLAGTLALAILQSQLNKRLKTAEAPANIVSFEFAKTPEKAAEILGAWSWEEKSGGDRQSAKRSLYWDFPYLIFYGLFFAFLSIRAGRNLAKGSWKIGRYASLFAILALLVALFDLIENIGLLSSIRDFELQKEIAPAPIWIAYWAATVKFTLLGLVLLYCLVGGGFWLFKVLKKK